MAVIAQADPYQGLIRKIGYSVGLEKLPERVEKVVDLYVRERSMPAGAFKDIVEREFGRKNAVEHFANLYSQLNLLRVTARQRVSGPSHATLPKAIEPLYQADALSILRRLLKDNEEFQKALRVVLLQAIIEADGDIFLNVLCAEGDATRLRAKLEAMVIAKRQALNGVIRTPGMLSKIYQIVDIKNESGGERQQQTEASGRFGRRTQPLDDSRRKSSLTAQTQDIVAIPDDYLSKAASSRTGWAQDLELIQDGCITRGGAGLLAQLQECCVSTTRTEPFALLFWGYKADLEKIRLQPATLGAKAPDAWCLLTAIYRSYSDLEPKQDDWSVDELIAFLRNLYLLYKEGNSKGIIRNGLPLYVAEPVLAAYSLVKGRALPKLHEILQQEYVQPIRRVQQMIIRGTSGALFFMD